MGLNRKERERKERRKAILGAAKSVFAEKGFDAAVLDEIAERAEFSKGAIYGYFKNKSDLFLSLIEEGLDEFLGITKDVVKSSFSPVDKVKELIQKILGYAEENKEFFCIFTPERGGMTSKRHPEIKKRVLSKYEEGLNLIAQVMEEGVREGAFKKIKPIILSRILLGLISSAIGGWIVRGGKGSLKRNADVIRTIFLEGVRSE